MFENKNVTHISISTGTMVRAVLVLVCVFLLWFLRDLALVVLTSIVIASFIDSSVPYFERIGIKNRIFGIVLFYTISLLILAGMFYLFAPLLITEIYNFSTFLSAYIPNISFFNFFSSRHRICSPLSYHYRHNGDGALWYFGRDDSHFRFLLSFQWIRERLN